MGKLRWGIIGFGAFADLRMGPAIMSLPDHELIAVMSRNINKAKKYAKKYNVQYYYDSVQDLVNNPHINAVYVVTPNYQHCQYTCMAAEKGLHILCEKPMAMNLKEAEKMVTVCCQNNVKLMIGNMMRFHSCHQWAKKCIKKGLLGEITAVRAKLEFYLSPEPTQWRFIPELSGGGAIMDVGIHCIDLLRYLIEKEVIQVSAFVNTQSYPFPIDIDSAILIRFDNGILGTINASFNNKYANSGFEIFGTEGSLIDEGSIGQEPTGKVTLITSKGSRTYESKLINPYATEAEHFAKCIENNKEPMINGEEGIKDLKICLAAYQSSQKNETIDISSVTFSCSSLQ